jgi:hypothetical protein
MNNKQIRIDISYEKKSNGNERKLYAFYPIMLCDANNI